MSITVLLAFVATCVFLAVTPGPNMALIVANTLRGGLRAGLVTLAGTVTGLSVLITIATIGGAKGGSRVVVFPGIIVLGFSIAFRAFTSRGREG